MATDRNAYMREWNKKNRTTLGDQFRAKQRQLEGTFVPGPRPCSKCGVLILMTPSRLARRAYQCNRCRSAVSVESRRRYKDTDYHKNHDKYLARRAVKRAVERGAIQREPCERCANTKAQAHHADYTKPLEVKWLCQWCHNIEHIEIKAKRA